METNHCYLKVSVSIWCLNIEFLHREVSVCRVYEYLKRQTIAFNNIGIITEVWNVKYNGEYIGNRKLFPVTYELLFTQYYNFTRTSRNMHVIFQFRYTITLI